MNYRIAQKIVNRYQQALEMSGGKDLDDFHWPGGGGSYSRSQVEKACKIMKISMKDLMGAIKVSKPAPKTVAKKAPKKKLVSKPAPVSTPVVERARTAEGTYQGDDPTTPETNEAWTSGKAPSDYTRDELRAIAKERGLSGYSRMKKADLLKALF